MKNSLLPQNLYDLSYLIAWLSLLLSVHFEVCYQIKSALHKKTKYIYYFTSPFLYEFFVLYSQKTKQPRPQTGEGTLHIVQQLCGSFCSFGVVSDLRLSQMLLCSIWLTGRVLWDLGRTRGSTLCSLMTRSGDELSHHFIWLKCPTVSAQPPLLAFTHTQKTGESPVLLLFNLDKSRGQVGFWWLVTRLLAKMPSWQRCMRGVLGECEPPLMLSESLCPQLHQNNIH